MSLCVFFSRAKNRVKLFNVRNEISNYFLCRYIRHLSTEENEGNVKRKSDQATLITLIRNKQQSVTTLEEAEKLSKRRDLILVKVIDLDTKTQRPIYKLITLREYQNEDHKCKECRTKNQNCLKGEKVLLISPNIDKNDLKTQIRRINKWIDKFYEVKIVVTGDNVETDKAPSVKMDLVMVELGCNIFIHEWSHVIHSRQYK
nr:uncharacterized protein LOC111507063 isoform X1 [Leptinotarsa decemlineata]